MNKDLMFSSDDMTWATPQDFFDRLNEEFKFTLDPCCVPTTAKCDTYFTPETDGLSKKWGGIRSSVILHMVENYLNGSRSAIANQLSMELQ